MIEAQHSSVGFREVGTIGTGKGMLPKICGIPEARMSGPQAEDATDCHRNCGALSGKDESDLLP